MLLLIPASRGNSAVTRFGSDFEGPRPAPYVWRPDAHPSARTSRTMPAAWAAVVQARMMSPAEVTSARDVLADSQIWAACPGSQRAASPRNTASCGARITSATAAVDAPMTLRRAAPSPADSSSAAVNQTTVLPPAHSATVDIAGHAARLAPTRTLAATIPVPASIMSRATASRPRAGVTSRLVMP